MLKFKNNIVHGAIFDMDGTMFDTERLRFKTLKQASKELIGVEFSDSYLMACLGLSATSALKLAQQQYAEDIPYTEIRKRADELELEAVRQFGVPIKSGLVQVLERLRKSGLRMAIATSSRRAIAEEYLINANVYKFFDVLVCGDEVEQGKPHPEIFLSAAEKINLAPNYCLMFEDSENGLRSAHDAGGICVLFKDIKVPNESMLAQADYYFESMYDYLELLDTYTAHLDMPTIQEAFPQTLNQLSVGIHGFGAIGGGYLAQILSHWDGYTRPKRIYASTRNSLFRSAVNAFGTYCIRYGQLSHDERIENMNIIDAENIQHIQEMYIESALIAICLPESAIEIEANAIAQGLYARYIAQDMKVVKPLTVLIILNKVGAKQLLLNSVREALAKITSPKIVDLILEQNYFCDTVVTRMASKLTDQNLYRQLNIKYNIFKQYQIDEESTQVDVEDETKLNVIQQQKANLYIEDMRQNFQSGHILQNMDLILFNSEIDMPIYVENNSPLLQKMRQIVLVDQIIDIQTIKNRLWNGVHAMTAWYAISMNHSTIGVAMGDTQVRDFVEKLILEVKGGLAEQIPVCRSELERLAQSFLSSCDFAYKDPCERVARDPLRKLQAQERVFSSLIYNIEHQLPFDTLLKGAVLGYVYAIQYDHQTFTEIQQHLKQQIKIMCIDDGYQLFLMDVIQEFVEKIDSGKMSLEEFMLLNDIDQKIIHLSPISKK